MVPRATKFEIVGNEIIILRDDWRAVTTYCVEHFHNATWEMNPKIFIVTDCGLITSRHIFFPDLTAEGTLIAFKNRKRFFADGNKVNDVLPELYFDVMQRIISTLETLLISQANR